MSDLPEDCDQGGLSPHGLGESLSVNAVHNEDAATVNSAPERGAGALGSEVGGDAEQESSDNNVSNAETDSKTITIQLPATRYENTPARPEHGATANSVPGLSVSFSSDAPAIHGQQHHDSRVNSIANADGEVNETTNVETASSIRTSPPSSVSQCSHTSANPDTQHPTNRETSDSEAEDAEHEDSPPGASLSRGHCSVPVSWSGSRVDMEDQDGDGETDEHEVEESNRPEQGAAVPRPDQALAESGRNDTRHSDRDVSSFGVGVPDRDNEAMVTSLDASHDGSRPSYGIDLHEPGHNIDYSTHSSHAVPISQTSTLSRSSSTTPQASRPSSSGLNPIAASFIPRPQQRGIPPEFAVPRWQPDSEVTHCPICRIKFSIFVRKHHCRKCGRVVCDRCSPHRITIPHPYIVRPPGVLPPIQQPSSFGIEGGIADFSSVGGGERVRLCNPCVPDPNTAPPQARLPSRPIVVDGRGSQQRSQSNSLGNYSAGVGQYSHHPASRQFLDGNPSRTRSATTSAGQGQAYLSFVPFASTSSHYPPPNSAYFAQPQLPPNLLVSTGRPRFPFLMEPPPPGHPGNPGNSGPLYSVPGPSTSLFGLDRPLPRTPLPEPEIPEEDACPVCHRELPSRALPNHEALRETHINNCITSHSSHRANQSMVATGTGSHGTPPPRTTRRTRIFPYIATEKDCVDDAECTICLEEFKVGDEMARLECFCRFHRSCIDSWFVNHPGRCPIHQHDSFGY